jgi:hypothetical protein
VSEHDLLKDYMPDAAYQKVRGIGDRQAARERASGRGPTFIRLGRRVFYYVPDVEAFITSLHVKPVRKPAIRNSRRPPVKSQRAQLDAIERN